MALTVPRRTPRPGRALPGVRRPARALLTTAGLAVLALLAPVASVASADDQPVFPSQAQVDASKQQVAAGADRVGQIEAQLAAANARSDRLAVEVGAAVEAYNGARVRLQQAQDRAAQAERKAAAARAGVAAARLALGRFAAAAYRSGGGGDLGGVETFLNASDPHDLISRISALRSVGDSRQAAVDTFRAAQAYASVLDARARDLVAKRQEATRQVARAKATAEARLAGQRQAVRQIADQRETLVRQLAAARHTSVRLERERQAGLERARAEAARREAERKAAEAARRAEEARAAAAARAAEEARRAAAEAARQADEKRKADEAAAAAARQADEKRKADEAAAAADAARQADEKRKADEAAARPAQPAGDSGSGNGGGGGGGGNAGGGGAGSPAPSPGGTSSGTASGAQAAIAYARAQIGKPYEWAADGPSTFDCSGLTMRAWQQGGVSLPHYSVEQYARSQKVALSDLRPGDLVFFASGGDYRSIYHVGLYIGDGQMIEAPYTGENVRISSIWRGSLFGAARP